MGETEQGDGEREGEVGCVLGARTPERGAVALKMNGEHLFLRS